MAAHEASLPVTRLWLALPYLLVVASTALVVARGPRQELGTIVVVAAVVLGWHTWWAVRHPAWLERAPVPMAIYFAGFLAGSAVLFHLSFNFLLLFLVCFALAFVALPGAWAYVGVALTVATALLVPGLLTPSVENLVSITAGGVVTLVAGWSIRAVETESAGRRAALADLQRTNDELSRALDDNAVLQRRLVETAHEQGADRERARIAAEIHDTLAADLSAVVAQLEALLGETRDPAVEARARTALTPARSALTQARDSVTTLRAEHASGATLPDAVADVVQEVAHDSGTQVRTAVDGEPVTVPDAVATALLRATGEAVRNAVRHADADSVVVTVSFLGETIAIDVVDDGRGFDTGAQRTGNGLAIVTERLEQVGGRAALTSTPGSGTAISLVVPSERTDGS